MLGHRLGGFSDLMMICWWENKHTIIHFSNLYYLVAAVSGPDVDPNLCEKTLSEARWVTLYIVRSVWVSNVKLRSKHSWLIQHSVRDWLLFFPSHQSHHASVLSLLLPSIRIRMERQVATPIIKQLMRFCTPKLPWISYNSNILTLVWLSKREKSFSALSQLPRLLPFSHIRYKTFQLRKLS